MTDPHVDHSPPGLDAPHTLFVFAILLLLWMLLAGSLHAQEWIAGLVVAALVTLISRPHLHVFSGVRLRPAALFHLVLYLGHFLSALVRANFDLAGRVLAPSLPIKPRLVEIDTQLTSPLGRMLLANSITLTPGTLTVDVQGPTLTIHCVYCPLQLDQAQITRQVAARFEKHIGGFLL